MEQSEAHHTQEHKADECVEHPQGIFKQHDGTIENPIGQHSTADDNGAINKQNAPIRQ
jgi:hypothetical protein